MMQRYRLLARALRRGAQGYELSQPASEVLRSPSDLHSWRALWGSAVSRGETRGGFPELIGSREALVGGIWRQQVRHAKVNGSEVKQGNVIERKGRIYQVLKTQHTQQGRGGATIQVELRDVQSGLKLTERFRTSESIERVFVDEKPYTFLYMEDSSVVLMEPKSFEQLELSKDMLGHGAAYLSDGMEVMVQQYNGQPFSATVPPKVTCTVSEAEPYFKGQSATPTYKRVVLENGQTILAPSFITAGDRVVIDTAENAYVTREKKQ
ncbi:hypothetical protein M758_6G091000 [Ceratodon purpureus]|uniref:Elongation factor P n=1 Tax=Ceratodon purpureus TaxID=3225 RepID=A0A8T0HEV3_CERPU|nr:hypothetical protein KC19_6G094700 [Ceratodon purpureus]KAG0613284.1 hypothetical protein M758_6G091000 [Ceratodon purpureus]